MSAISTKKAWKPEKARIPEPDELQKTAFSEPQKESGLT